MPVEIDTVEAPLSPDVRQRLDDLAQLGKTLEDQARIYTRQVQQAVSAILGAVTSFEEGWRVICREVLAGRTSETQTLRDRFLHAFQHRLRLLREARELIRLAERANHSNLPEAALLDDEAMWLEQKLNRLTTRWQTVEDLEDLAAESLAPSKAKLEAVRAKFGYPQAWYDEDSKPF